MVFELMVKLEMAMKAASKIALAPSVAGSVVVVAQRLQIAVILFVVTIYASQETKSVTTGTPTQVMAVQQIVH